jgi:hypothetical protein
MVEASEPRHDILAYRRAQLSHSPCNLTSREIRPLHVRPHRVASGVIFYDDAEVFDDFTRSSFRFLAAAVFFRWRLSSSCVGGFSISDLPC